MTDEYALETILRTLCPVLYNPPNWIPCHTRWHGVSQLLGLNHGQSVALCYALGLEPFETNYPCNLKEGGWLGDSAPDREGSAQNRRSSATRGGNAMSEGQAEQPAVGRRQADIPVEALRVGDYVRALIFRRRGSGKMLRSGQVKTIAGSVAQIQCRGRIGTEQIRIADIKKAWGYRTPNAQDQVRHGPGDTQ